MNIELDELFSDFDFFNKILVNFEAIPSLNVFLSEIFKHKEIRSEVFNHSNFELEDFYLLDEDCFSFCFEINNSNKNEYYPNGIVIKKDKVSEKYKLHSISYKNNEKGVVFGHCFYDPLLKRKEIKDIYFYNDVYDAKFQLDIIEETVYLRHKKNLGNSFKNYLEELKTVKEAAATANRILLLQPLNVEETEIELLKHDMLLENSIYSGKLNKAEHAFKGKL